MYIFLRPQVITFKNLSKMKQLIIIGSTGNNMCVVQIPTSWSLGEAKDFLEKALLQFEENKARGEFLTINDEEELGKIYVEHNSEIKKCVKELIDHFGSPISGAGGLSWQIRVQNYILTNKIFANKIFKAFNKKLTVEDELWLQSNYLDILPIIVKTLNEVK